MTDLIAEKFRALLQQVVRNQHRQQKIYRRQDVYDIAHLVTRFPPDDGERSTILESFREKCAARGITPTADSLSDPRIAERARAEWNSLRGYKPKPPKIPSADDFGSQQRLWLGSLTFSRTKRP
jgi:Nucleotidyl transferase AbiEii toxin, Type IV TA system